MERADFYTYAYLRDDNTPYYIGKGSGKRCYKKHANVQLPKVRDRILILKKGLTENEAFCHEMYMIFIFGRKDKKSGILLNFTDGGEGASGRKCKEETKRKLKKKMSGPACPNYGIKRSKETRQRQKEARSGKTHSEETIQKMIRAHTGKTASEEHRKNNSESHKGELNSMFGKKGELNPNFGKKHWVNPSGERLFCSKSPGENWQLGKKWKD